MKYSDWFDPEIPLWIQLMLAVFCALLVCCYPAFSMLWERRKYRDYRRKE